MAPTKFTKAKVEETQAPGLSLGEIVATRRQKEKNEKLAQRIFGKDRRASAPGALDKRNKTTDGLPSLASRIGIQKRTTKSTVNLRRDNQTRAKTLLGRYSPAKDDVIEKARPEPESVRQNISIRGLAGPATVMAQNFAPGTTAADIRSAFEPVGGEMLSCRLKASNPTIIAEMIFADRAGAEVVIETFNNQKADGRLLYVYLQASGGGGSSAQPAPTTATRRAGTQGRPAQQSEASWASSRTETRAWDDGDRQAARAEPEYQDGRYGFENPSEEMDIQLDQPPVSNTERYDNSSSRRDDRGGYRPQQNGSYRDGGRYNDRNDRGPRQDRGLYSDKYAQGSGRSWR